MNYLKAYVKNIDTKPPIFLLEDYTFLHLAATLKATDEARQIIEAKKYDINDHGNDKGFTALWIACSEDDEAMVNLLLRYGANPNIATKTGMTPLISAIQKGDSRQIHLLLSSGANVDYKDTINNATPLHVAIACGNSDIVKLLLEHKASPDLDSEHCFTPLMAATQMEAKSTKERAHCLRMVKALLDAKANPAIVCLEDGDTALHIAVGKWKKEEVYLLLKAGADPNALNAEHETPFLWVLQVIRDAEQQADYDSIQKACSFARLLLLYGATLSKKQLKNIDLNTLLTYGVTTGTSELVKFSLEAGANANHKNSISDTLLHVLVLKQKKGIQSSIIAHLLLEHGADIDLVDARKHSVLDASLENICSHGLIIKGCSFVRCNH